MSDMFDARPVSKNSTQIKNCNDCAFMSRSESDFVENFFSSLQQPCYPPLEYISVSRGTLALERTGKRLLSVSEWGGWNSDSIIQNLIGNVVILNEGAFFVKNDLTLVEADENLINPMSLDYE